MFLDDELYQIGKKVDLSNPKSIENTVINMVKAAGKNLEKRLPETYTLNEVFANLKRVNTQFKNSVEKLSKEGLDFCKADGFYLYCLNHPDKEIKELINKYKHLL